MPLHGSFVARLALLAPFVGFRPPHSRSSLFASRHHGRNETIEENGRNKDVNPGSRCETSLRPPPPGTHSAHLHTHRFPCVRNPPGRHALIFSVFPLADRTPTTRLRITRVARIRAPSAENRSDVQKSPFFPFFFLCSVHQTYHTHACARFLFLLGNTIAPYRTWTLRVLRLFYFHLQS